MLAAIQLLNTHTTKSANQNTAYILYSTMICHFFKYENKIQKSYLKIYGLKKYHYITMKIK